MTTLNPVCSEAVFRLGEKWFRLWTDIKDDMRWFVRWLKNADDGELDGYRTIDDGRGEAHIYIIKGLIKARRRLGKRAFSRLPADVAWEWEEGTIAVVVGRKRHYLPKKPEELFLALLREGEQAEAVAVRPEAKKLCELFRKWKEGKMTREQFRAKALAILLLEAGR